jgi:integrase/recombinase XerD
MSSKLVQVEEHKFNANPMLSNEWNKGELTSVCATSDVMALNLWIKERGFKSKNTEQNYIRETEKLRAWLSLTNKSLASVTREDMFTYREFLHSPPESLCGDKSGKEESGWRPFYTNTPSNTTVRQSFGVACAMFSWLKLTGYIKINPAESIPREVAKPQWRRRSLSDTTLKCIRDFLEEMPSKTDTQIKKRNRARWLFNLLRLTGVRIGEVQSAKMSDIVNETRKGKSRTFLRVIGKGNKERLIPVIEELQEELELYRTSLGLSPCPEYNEKTPLVCSIENGRENAHMTRQALHNAIKLFIDKTHDKLMSLECFEDAAILKKASAHWMRHTYATNLADSGVSAKTGRDNLGHANMSTFNIYLHTDEDERFDETEKYTKRLGG